MSSKPAIKVMALTKTYQIYERPSDRLRQFVMPRTRRLLGMPARNYFGEFWALNGVGFEVARGETVGIVGRNGSGKSTLLQIIAGTLSPSAGSVEISGRVAALLELGSGFNPDFTGIENVYLNAMVLGLSRAEIDNSLEAILAFSEIGEFAYRPVKTYSSGMMMRLAFAVAISVEPQILIVDEALSVGDERFQRKCFSRIEAIKRKGATILFVSHSGSAIVELCDRAILLDAGEVIAQGSPKQVIAAYQKLLYAPGISREAIRRDLQGSIFSVSEAKQAQSSGLLESECIDTLRESLQDYFDPTLVPSTTIEYLARGASIETPALYSILGERVNSVNKGRRYCYVYSVFFTKSAVNVSFGMLIKTVLGIEIGGSTSAPPGVQGIPFIPAGTRLAITFEFDCQLNAGIYFLNAGVMAEAEEGVVYLHRILDACMFRVQPTAGDTATATVDFRCTASVNVAAMVSAGVTLA